MISLGRQITLLLLLCAGLPPHAARAATPANSANSANNAECQVAPSDPIFSKPSWYGLYWEKAKAGYLWTFAEMSQDGFIDVHYRISITIGGVENITGETRRFDTSAPHRLRSGKLLTDGQNINYQMLGEGLQLQTGGRTLSWPKLDWQLCNEGIVSIRRALDRAVSPGDEFESSYLDIKDMSVISEHHIIEQVETRSVQGVEHRFQTLLTRARIEGMNTRYRQRFRDGEAVTVFLGQLEARLETEAQAKAPVQDIEALDVMTLPVNSTLETDRILEISSLEVKVSINDSLTSIKDVVQDGLMQQVSYIDEQTALVTIGEHAQPAGTKESVKQQPAEQQPVSDFLIANLVYPADHPRIRAIADEIASTLPGEAGSLEHAQAILHYSAAYLRYELTTSATVLETLDSRSGDCTEYARLFVSLARASGFPAREVSGFIYTGTDERGEFGGHAWVEVFVAGQWHAMDPTSNQIKPDKTHVQFTNFLVSGISFEITGVRHQQR